MELGLLGVLMVVTWVLKFKLGKAETVNYVSKIESITVSNDTEKC